MKNKHFVHITAVTQVCPDGQKCIRAVIEMDCEIEPSSVSKDTFHVQGRHVTSVEAVGKKIILELDSQDENAMTYHPGNPWMHIPSTVSEASVEIVQKSDIYSCEGEVIPACKEIDFSDQCENELVDEFIQGEFEGLKYNLFIPRDYDSRKKYPLVQFIHDAGPTGSDPRLTLTQGIGAVVWTTEEEQKKHSCFVFAPQFDGAPIVDDNWNVDSRLEIAKSALDQIVADYSIDTTRIYTTGQSMGCMSSIVLNIRYPEFFAASLLIAGQWDEQGIEGLEKQHLWMINSQGDAKAFPIMNQMNVVMEHRGAKIVHHVWRADLSQQEYKEIADTLIATGANIIYTPYLIETVADGWHSNGGEHHVNTWRTAYGIEAVREWLFSNHR